jgi:hypothetical protein
MPVAPAVVERTMKVQEVLMKAISGQLTWLEAEDILGWQPRTLRRWRLRYRQRGYDGLWDRRRQLPSPRCAPVAEVARITRLYREQYAGFTVAHFHEFAHGGLQEPFDERVAERDPMVALACSRSAARGAATVAAASRAPASASCCTSTAAPMPGWPCGPRSGRR